MGVSRGQEEIHPLFHHGCRVAEVPSGFSPGWTVQAAACLLSVLTLVPPLMRLGHLVSPGQSLMGELSVLPGPDCCLTISWGFWLSLCFLLLGAMGTPDPRLYLPWGSQ